LGARRLGRFRPKWNVGGYRGGELRRAVAERINADVAEAL